jgi:GNAT superfamily N-acetyltransferase
MNLEKFQYTSSKGLSIVLEKHEGGGHDQSTHGNWATGGLTTSTNIDSKWGEVPSQIGEFTLDPNSDPKGITTYNHPNGSRVIFQGIDDFNNFWGESPVYKNRIEETLDIVNELQKKYPLSDLTIAIENDPNKQNKVRYPTLGQTINTNRDGYDNGSTYIRPEHFLSKNLPDGKATGSYIVLNSKIMGKEGGQPHTLETLIRSEGDYYESNRLMGNIGSKNNLLKTTLTHEYGHALDNRSETVATSAFKGRDDTSTSMYGRTNSREYFAETFTAWELDKSNPKWKPSFDWLNMDKVGTKVNKSAGNGILFIVQDRFDGKEPFLQEFGEVLKHGTGDQKPHGSWARGENFKMVSSLIDKLSEIDTPGFSINIISKKKPRSGYMVSDFEKEKPIPSKDFFSSRSASKGYIKDYIKENAQELSEKGAYLGGWVYKGKVYLDVSRRYASKKDAVYAVFDNKQISGYDVEQDSYFYRKDEVDDRANKASNGGSDQASQSDDRGGTGLLRGGSSPSNRGQSLTYPHICLGRYSVLPVEKHEQHDQKTHGNWAGVGGLPTFGKELLTLEQIKEFDNKIKKVPESHIEALKASGTKIRIMDSPKIMTREEIPHFNGGDNEISLDKNSGASALLHEIGHALDFNAKSGNGYLSDDPNFRKIIKESKFPDFSTRRVAGLQNRNYYRTEEFAVAYDNYYTDGGEFMGASPTKEFKQVMEGIGTYILSEKVQKHAQHDQQTHGSWANSSERSAKEIEIQGRISNVKVVTYPLNEYGGSGSRITADYQTKNGEIIKLIHDNEKTTSDKKIQMDTVARAPFKGGSKEIGFLTASRSRYEEEYAVIDRIQVEPEYKRQGIGTAMLNLARSYSQDGIKIEHSFALSEDAKGWSAIVKHLEGQHDQATHGNWAGDRYPADSLKSARDGAKEYAFKKGLKPDDSIDYTKVVANRERASKIADIYESLPKMDRDAVDEYEALASEVEEQFNYMTQTLGVKVEFVAEDPYKTSKEMFADVSTGSLKVLSTATTGAHPIFSDEQNNKFRAVHDYFGHAATGRGFGQDGEESAWVHHSQMFTKNARAALTTETRGQNSFFNNRGKQFADQKVALLPEEFWAVPKVFQKTKVIYFAPGLKPVLKHGEGDQKPHGNWARGVSAEDEALIGQMSNAGPTKEEILNTLVEAEYPDLSDLEMMVNEDRGLYEQAIEDIDERVDREMSEFGWDDTTKHDADFIENQRNTVYENTQNEMISEFIQNDDGTIANMWMEQQGVSLFNPEEFHSAFDDVYSIEHEVTNNEGEVVTGLTSQTTDISNDSGILMIQGDITDSDDNYAGRFQRSFYKETNDDGEEILVVEHDLFRMADEYQGSGFGGKFLAQQEAYYVAKEIDAINVGTAWDGARHWARAGFDFNPQYLERNIETIVNRANIMNKFAVGTPARQEFDALMKNTVEFYSVEDNSIVYENIKSMKENNFPIPNDFAMIGYSQRTQTGTNDFGKPTYTWAGKELLYDMNLKYRKVLTKEGRTINQGPIDRDGDGLVYDGTAREKPVSAVNSAP